MSEKNEMSGKGIKFDSMLVHGRVSEFMSTPPITLKQDAKISEAKALMRDNRISGIPIVDDEGELIGIITIENIIVALENDWMDDQISKHLVSDVVSLTDTMDISFVIEYLNKYSFNRYPVIDNENKVVGVVTKGDLMLYLYARLGSVYLHNKKIDDVLKPIIFPDLDRAEIDELSYNYNIDTLDIEMTGMGSTMFKKFLQDRGFDGDTARRASISLYEAEVNVVIHGGGKGYIKAYINEDQVFVVIADYGPGIDDIELAMQPGWTTATDAIREKGFGAGMGLDNIKKYSDKLAIVSNVGHGVKIEMVFIAKKDEKPEERDR